MRANTSMNDLDRPGSGFSGAVDPLPLLAPRDAPQAAISIPAAPADLLDFVHAQSVRESANALRLSLGTIHRLVQGYWPADPRKILQAWSAYKGRAGRIASSWFLRRVRSGGIVCHAGKQWSGQRLATRVGELLAVARAEDGGLLAQTLELPPERLPLVLINQ